MKAPDMTQVPKTPLRADPAEGPVKLDQDLGFGAMAPCPELSTALSDADVFRASVSRITLAQVLAAVETTLTGTALRDTRSAFATLTRAGVDPAGTVATAANVWAMLDALSL